MTQNLTYFEGGNALGAFRVAQLLPRLAAVHERIAGLSARFVHLVDSAQPLTNAQHVQLAALLRYGDPALKQGEAHWPSGENVAACDAPAVPASGTSFGLSSVRMKYPP